MYIHTVQIKRFRHLEDESIGPFNFPSRSSDLIAFAGPNGSGKSSILELIGYALSSSYSLSWSLSRTFSGFSFEVAIALTAAEKKIVVDALEKEVKDGVRDFALSADEREQMSAADIAADDQSASLSHRSHAPHFYQLLAYLKSNDVYYRSFNYEQGEYQKNPNLQNQIHGYVTRELKDTLKRSLGFFLRADRSYPQKHFNQQQIFSYSSVNRTEHLWSMAFNTSEIQYQDMYDFLVQQRYHYLRDLGHFHNQKNKGNQELVEPADPLIPYENLLSTLFPEYKFADKNEPIPSNLFVQIPSGETITFNDLSSGEKEVFFILSFFIRHNVENAIIVIDEPELHLHPELSRLLVRSMRSIRTGNQIWVATHNPEIVDEAGRDRVTYVTRDAITRKSRLLLADQEQQAVSELRNLFGVSGYIGIARNLVFLEGENSSQDRKFFSTLFPSSSSSIKLIPASSSGGLTKLNTAVLSILESNLGWMNFFMIRDRDYLSNDMAERYAAHASGKIFVLAKHELENYLIDLPSLRVVLSEIFGIDRSIEQLKAEFYSAALKMSADVMRDMIAFRLNLLLRPQDFSLQKAFSGQSYFSSQGRQIGVRSEVAHPLREKFVTAAERIRIELSTSLSESAIHSVIDECEREVVVSLEGDGWLDVFPGKELISAVAKQLGVRTPVALQNSVLKELAANSERIDTELTSIFSRIENS